MKLFTTLLLIGISTLAASANASITLGGTRVVYHEARNEATLPTRNEGSAPELIQVWIDDGDINAKPETLKVPFTVTPAMARIEPGDGQSLRIRAQGARLPKDRESAYYLNVLAVPRKAANAAPNEAVMQLAMRTRIKIFYRPSDLAGQANDAAARVTWSLQQQGGKPVLVGTNPTPFHVSYSQVSLRAGEQTHTQGRAADGGGGMIAPFDSRSFPLGDLQQIPANASAVSAEWINDYGGKTTQVTSLAP